MNLPCALTSESLLSNNKGRLRIVAKRMRLRRGIAQIKGTDQSLRWPTWWYDGDLPLAECLITRVVNKQAIYRLITQLDVKISPWGSCHHTVAEPCQEISLRGCLLLVPCACVGILIHEVGKGYQTLLTDCLWVLWNIGLRRRKDTGWDESAKDVSYIMYGSKIVNCIVLYITEWEYRVGPNHPIYTWKYTLVWAPKMGSTFSEFVI